MRYTLGSLIEGVFLTLKHLVNFHATPGQCKNTGIGMEIQLKQLTIFLHQVTQTTRQSLQSGLMLVTMRVIKRYDTLRTLW